MAAGIALENETKDGTEVLDFHSLRGTFATFLDGLDISLKARQELMRHSDPRLTMNRYTRAKLHDVGAAVEKLPQMGPIAPQTETVVLGATGTEGGAGDHLTSLTLPSGNHKGRKRTNSEKIDLAGIISLKELDLTETKVAAASVSELRKVLPDCKIKR
jgi:hypothetical protein